MKVAYNACHGGFTLSKAACEELSKRKGKPIDYYDYYACDDLSRTDSDLIAVIENLGSEKASGSYSEIRIKEIPDGVEYEITEYDGFEDVVPPRQTWS